MVWAKASWLKPWARNMSEKDIRVQYMLKHLLEGCSSIQNECRFGGSGRERQASRNRTESIGTKRVKVGVDRRDVNLVWQSRRKE